MQSNRISYLIIMHLRTRLTPEETEELKAWREESQYHEALFFSLTDKESLRMALLEYMRPTVEERLKTFKRDFYNRHNYGKVKTHEWLQRLLHPIKANKPLLSACNYRGTTLSRSHGRRSILH